MTTLKLTPSHISSYHTDGYLIIRATQHNLIDPTTLLSWTADLRTWPRVSGKWMPYDETSPPTGRAQLMRIENFAPYHPGFNALLMGPELRGLLAQLTGEEMLLFKEKVNFKLPGGNGFEAHIDAPAYEHVADIEHTTANLAVDAATVANGCVEVVPGSHRTRVEHEGGRITKEWEEEQEWVPVELEMGDLLVFGSRLAHRSGRNETKRSRGGVYATYAMRKDGEGLREAYYADRRINFPPDHERVKGKDYSQGIARYAFAAPFTNANSQLVSSQTVST